MLILLKNQKKKNFKVIYATKTFQALRIFVNKEISELIYGLINSAKVLKKDGILAVVTFHSLEDKIVKYFLKIFLKIKVFLDMNQKLIKKIFFSKPAKKTNYSIEPRNKRKSTFKISKIKIYNKK